MNLSCTTLELMRAFVRKKETSAEKFPESVAEISAHKIVQYRVNRRIDVQQHPHYIPGDWQLFLHSATQRIGQDVQNLKWHNADAKHDNCDNEQTRDLRFAS